MKDLMHRRIHVIGLGLASVVLAASALKQPSGTAGYQDTPTASHSQLNP